MKLVRIAFGYTVWSMITTLQAWGNSQGVRLPKPLLTALGLDTGATVEVGLTPKKDAIIVRPAKAASRVRGRHRIEDLVAKMPKNDRAAEWSWGTRGREVW